MRDWSSMGKSLWYVYGTLIGESMTRDTKVRGWWQSSPLVLGP